MAKPQWPMFAYDGANAGLSPHKGPQTNRLRWQFALPGWGSSVVVGANGAAYVGTRSDPLFALDEHGVQQWRFQMPIVRVTPPPDLPEAEREELNKGIRANIATGLAIEADGTVYFGDALHIFQVSSTEGHALSGYHRHLYALDGDGSVKGKFGAGGEFYKCPSMDAKDTLYLCHSGGPGEITGRKLKCYAISDTATATLPAPKQGKPIKGPAEAVASARKDARVKELLERHPEANASAYFSDQYGVWIVEFVEGKREIGFASVSKDGRVLEVGAGEVEEREERENREMEYEAGRAVDSEQRGKKLQITSGQYMGHKWHVDENHLMWWDGKPYVPFGGFGIEPGNKFGLNTFNLWIDFDPFIDNPDYTTQEHRHDIAEKLDAITKAGGTCIVQFSMALPHIPEGPKPGMRWREPEGGIDGSRLADPGVRRAILKVWEYYAPAVRKECVRAIVLWNEINVWRWPDRVSAKEYGEILGEYARKVKQMVGDLPVCFKIAGAWNAAAAIAGAAAADGLGFDVWFTGPDDEGAPREIERALRMLGAPQKKTTWFFIAEGGRGIAEGGTDEAPAVGHYWDRWPPFRSKKEARGILRAYALAGAKGFIYNGPSSRPGSNYHDSYRWLGEMKPEITCLMVETKPPAPETPLAATAARAIAAAETNNRLSAWPVGLGKIVPPKRGIYLGQTELEKGDIASLERATGRSVAIAADLSVVTGQEEAGERNLSFDIRRACSYWDRGTVLLVGAYEAYPGHKPFTVDKLLRGEYDAELKRLASQFRAFGKPMFFSTAREPNGVLADYMGGFGPRGDKDVGWAERTGHGYDEFKPPAGPPGKPGLYAGLGDPRILDGIERLAAAQRYYHDFFVRRERLSFLTFDTMGWAVPTWQTDEKPVARFEDLYPLVADYCDWVSINFYMATEHQDDETGRVIPEPPLNHYLEALDAFMERVGKIAPDKPVLITELGFADPSRAEKIQRGLGAIATRYPQIKGVIGWGGDFAIRPDTPAGAVFQRIIDEHPALFHSRVRFSQGGPGASADGKGNGCAVSDEETITSPTAEQRMEALKCEIEKARTAGNQREVSEILELLGDLRADHEVHGEAEDEVERGGREPAPQGQQEALERALEEARQQGNQQEQREILERLLELARKRGDEQEASEIRELLQELQGRADRWDDHEPAADLSPAAGDILIRAGELSLRFGTNGQVKALTVGNKTTACKLPTVYRLNKQRASVAGLEKTQNGVRVVVKANEEQAVVSIEGGERITVRFETHASNVTFGLGLPLSTRFHVVDRANLAQRIDEKRLRQEPSVAHQHGLTYQLMLAELDAGFLSISGRSDYRKPVLPDEYQRAALYRLRHRGEDLAFEWTWRPEFPLILSWHDSMQAAATEYRKWMEKAFHIRPLADTPGKWVQDLKLVITLDMWRPNGDIAHTYQHGIDLARDLHQAGARGDILFYIPGWCGMYDASYPDYTPKPELGGEAKFREMIGTFHKYGYRAMIHVLPWGADPYAPSFDEIKHLARKEETEQTENPPVAWPACYPAKESDYGSGKQRLSRLKPQGRKVTFDTVRLPRNLEAHITVGGIRFAGNVRLSTNFRSLTSPKGYFSRHDSYEYPYTFLLYQGKNGVSLQFIGDQVPDLSGAWYRIHDAIYSDMIWTYPIVGMNVEDPQWVELFTKRVVDVVRKYGIDAVHVDAQHLWDIDAPNVAINRVLKAELPEIVFSTEKPTEPSMTMFQLAQNGVVPLEDVEEGEIEPSPLAKLLFRPYRRSYLHLCAPEGFVPTASVCNIERKPRPLDEERLAFNRRRFARSPEFGVIRNIRVNYRDYGLDEETKKRIASLY